MEKPVLAVDFDDVIANYNQAYLTFNNREYGTTITYDGIHTYNMSQVYGMDGEEQAARLRYFSHHEHHTIVPIEGALAALDSLHETYRIMIVTSRCESLSDITHAWLAVHSPAWTPEIIFTNASVTDFPERRKSKLPVCKDIQAVALIDDSLTTANEVAAGGVPVYLPDRPWNKGDMVSGVHRVHSWAEIVAALQPA